MSAIATLDDFLGVLRKSALIGPDQLEAHLRRLRADPAWQEQPRRVADLLVRDGLITTFQARQLLAGKAQFVLLNKYKVLDLLGAGGMGKVFLCEQVLLHRLVAVKVLPPAIKDAPGTVERFFREARAVAAVKHPNIVQIFDIDQGRGTPLLVMEFVDGATLQKIVADHGPFDVRRACHYVCQAALGLQHAYEQGLIHRDIKPENLMLDRSGTVKILDLGLARFQDDRGDNLTGRLDEKTVMGTADYISPEQAMDGKKADIRSDLYSLGATFYALLAGRAPFADGTTAQKLLWHQMRNPEPLGDLRPDVPVGIIAVIDRMMAKDPAARFQTPAEVIDALVPLVEPGDLAPPPEAEMPPPVRVALAGGIRSPADSTVTPASLTSSSVRNNPFRSRGTMGPDTLGPAASITPPPGSHRSGTAAPIARPAPVLTGGHIGLLVGGALLLAVAGFFLTWAFWPTGDRPAASGLAAAPTQPNLAAPTTPAPTVPVDTRPAATMPVAAPPKPADVWASEGKRTVVVAPDQDLRGRWPGKPVFPTLKAACDQAQEGDVIRVVLPPGAALAEALRLDGDKLPRNLTVEGFRADGLPGPVDWQPPPGHDAQAPLLALHGTQRLKVRNFRLEGKNAARQLIAVTGFSLGLHLEDLECHGFQFHGVLLLDCQSLWVDRLTLARVRFLADASLKAFVPLQIQATAGQACREILLDECRFEGPCEAAIGLKGVVRNLECRNGRFLKVDAAILYDKAEPPAPLDVALVNNTFAEAFTVFQLQHLPPAGAAGGIDFRNNLITQTKALVRLGQETTDAPAKVKPLFTSLAGTVREPNDCLEGVFFSEVTPRNLEPLPLDPANDATFLRPPAGSPLATLGSGGGPVGAAAPAARAQARPTAPARPRLSAGGASFVKLIMEKWAAEYRREFGRDINYQSLGSSAGQKGAIDRSFDFGCSEAFLPDADLKRAQGIGGDVLHLPLVLGAVVPVYNLPTAKTPLKFSRAALADVFLGKIRRWNDPALKALNPDVDLPDLPITTVHRSDGSGTTFVFTDALTKFSAEWKAKVGGGNTVKWPTVEGQTHEAKGNEGIAGAVLRTEGALGYTELGFAQKSNLKYGRVENQAGAYVLPNLETVVLAVAAILSQKDLPEDLRFTLTDAPGAESYPIVATSYALLYAAQAAEKKDAVLDFLRWAVSEDGQRHTVDLGYAPIPRELVERIAKKLDQVKAK